MRKDGRFHCEIIAPRLEWQPRSEAAEPELRDAAQLLIKRREELSDRSDLLTREAEEYYANAPGVGRSSRARRSMSEPGCHRAFATATLM